MTPSPPDAIATGAATGAAPATGVAPAAGAACSPRAPMATASLAAPEELSELLRFPVKDPALSLPETAQKLLEAARRLLLAGGFDALRLDAIAAESGRNKASIKYYFGNKDGLIRAILDSLWYDDSLALAEQIRGATGDERLERYIAGVTQLVADEDGFRVFFDLLPHVIRDERLRLREAALYEWYYKMTVEWLGLAERVRPENRERYVGFVSLMVAMVDGLALQAALRPKDFDFKRSFAVLEFFLKHCLGDFLDSLDEPQIAE
jgi:AcrR family transcriptional regulator